MKLGIMQPYFFPYLGYFDLINRTDRWVVFDTPQYTPKTWMNRNRILHPSSGWQYVTVAVSKFERFSPVMDIRVKNLAESRDRIVNQLAHYRKRAPFYTDVVELVQDAFDSTLSDKLVELNTNALRKVCERLGITMKYDVFSRMDLPVPEVTHPGWWALEISDAMNATEYINPPGGKELFDEKAFQERGIRLSFTEVPEFLYDCAPYEHVPNLSILDVMMWCSPERIKTVLDTQTMQRLK